MKNPRTTTAGIAGVVAAVATAVAAYFDGDPTTTVNVPALLAAIAIFFPSLAALFARDSNKTSEQVGAK